MEVLRKSSEWQMEVTCRNCGCLLAVKQDDIVYTGAPWGSYIYKCAECAHDSDDLESNLPFVIREQVHEAWVQNHPEEYERLKEMLLF